jgi:hypothetical protein
MKQTAQASGCTKAALLDATLYPGSIEFVVLLAARISKG